MINLARLRIHGHLWPILQTAVAAVGAWYIAVVAGVEHRPAFASIADLPEWCTVTVHVSNGASQAYQLAQYLQNPGDLYKFTAYVGGYRVDVSTRVVDRNKAAECDTTLANLGPA